MIRFVGWKREIRVAAAILAMGVTAGAAQAASLTATDVDIANTFGDGTTSAPGFGTGSLQQIPGPKAEYYVDANTLFGHSVAVKEIDSISYWTKKDSGSVDWYLAIYTAQQGDAGDMGSFYRSRLEAEPSESGAGYTPGAWTQWSTNDATNPLKFNDQPRTGTFNAGPTLAEIQAGSVDWNASVGQGPSSWDYNDEEVSLFSLQTASGWAGGFDGFVDGLTVTLKSGEVGTVNFEPSIVAVPVPASVVTGLVGLAIVAGITGRRSLRQPN
ncbi:MAG: hypothetical protein NTW19_10170 [Planctomycetota bacterium]|nr:hypothetical protein [Planctomycetota bacterium]